MGQVGDGSTTDRETPLVVPGFDRVATVSAGHRSTCTTDAQGAIRCFGEPIAGAFAPAGLASVVAVGFPDPYATPLLLADGGVVVWGDDVSAALGAAQHRVEGVEHADSTAHVTPSRAVIV